MTFDEATSHMLTVHLDYLFVYPVHKPDANEWTRVDDRVVEETQFPDPAQYQTTPGKLNVTDDPAAASGANPGPAGALCGFHGGFTIPSYRSDRYAGGGGAGPTGPPIDPFAAPTVLPTGGSGATEGVAPGAATGGPTSTGTPNPDVCGTVSRT